MTSMVIAKTQICWGTMVPPPKRWMFVLLVKRFRHLFCNSKFTADLAVQKLGIPKNPIVIGCGIRACNLPRPIPRGRARRKLSIDAKHVIVTVSRLTPHKGIDMVIRALPEVLSHLL